MFSQIFESLRKASESSLLNQQQLFKHWLQQWPYGPTASGASPDSSTSIYKGWLESVNEALDRHREALDSTYRNAIHVLEQTLRVSDAKSADEYRRLVEEAWRQLLEALQAQADAQTRELRKLAETWRSHGHHR